MATRLLVAQVVNVQRETNLEKHRRLSTCNKSSETLEITESYGRQLNQSMVSSISQFSTPGMSIRTITVCSHLHQDQHQFLTKSKGHWFCSIFHINFSFIHFLLYISIANCVALASLDQDVHQAIKISAVNSCLVFGPKSTIDFYFYGCTFVMSLEREFCCCPSHISSQPPLPYRFVNMSVP